MEKAFVAKGVATQLFAAENSMDAALADASKLMSAMVQARTDLSLSATVGAAAFAKVADAITAITEARSALVEAHGELATVARKTGVSPVAIGDGGSKFTGDVRRPSGLRAAS